MNAFRWGRDYGVGTKLAEKGREAGVVGGRVNWRARYACAVVEEKDAGAKQEQSRARADQSRVCTLSIYT